MNASFDHGYLHGQLLVATPNVVGPHFSRSVILLFAHSEEGAMGVILNHKLDQVTYQDMFEQLNLPSNPHVATLPVYYGGPVEVNRGFLLYEHQGQYLDEAMAVVGEVAISGSLGVLKTIAAGGGPKRHLLALGYAGWAPGQLEEEIQENSWFSVPMDSDLIFSNNLSDKWQQAGKLQGIDISKFSTLAGHA